jgi:hypothetical protein
MGYIDTFPTQMEKSLEVKSSEVIITLIEHIILHFRFPVCLQSDCNSTFLSLVTQRVCQVLAFLSFFFFFATGV